MENLKNILTTVNWNDRNTIFATVAAVASVAVAVQLLTTSLTKPLLPLPPSPKGRLPVLGHLLAVSTSSHLTFTEWSKQLGPIFSIQLGSQTWIILTSSKVIRDLVDLRGSIYSDRHNNPIADILSRNGEMYGFAKNGDYLRMWRRLTNNTISKSKLQANFNHVFDRESRELLARLLRDGARLDGVDVDDVTYLYTINVMLSILYNRRCATSSDPLVQEIRGISNDFIEFGSDIFLNFFPILITFFAGKKRRATALQDRLVLYIESLVEEVRQKLAKGEQIPCVAAEFVKVQEKEGITDMGVIQTCGGFTLAGVDNSAILLMNSAIILANHPEIQDRVHHELFATVGPDRLPEQSDAEKTPYVEAFLLEMFRFRPPGFFGIPHCSTEDDVYEGYRIPGGASVVLSVHTLHFDPTLFPNPDKFEPERWLSEDGKSCDSSKHHWAFGAGRRICPGQFVAERLLLTTFARLIWAFKIEFALSPQGTSVHVPITPIERINTRPDPFRLRFVPRRENIKDVIGLQ